MSVTRSALQLALRRPLLDYLNGLTVTVLRAWEGKALRDRNAGQIYLSDKLAPATRDFAGHSHIVGRLTLDGLYLIQWYGLPNQGLALAETADAVVDLYPPGTSLVTADGNAVQIKRSPAPNAGEIRPVDGASVVTITVPYQCVTVAPVVSSAA